MHPSMIQIAQRYDVGSVIHVMPPGDACTSQTKIINELFRGKAKKKEKKDNIEKENIEC